MLVVGLTGNYGMGKSVAVRMFAELGVSTIDADDIVGDLLKERDVIYEIKNLFGDEIVKDGIVDKKAVAALVFADPALRISLENILHPKVFARIEKRIAELVKEQAGMVVVEVPVLFERGYQNKFDKIITVFASEEATLSRLAEKGVSGKDAASRLKSQFPVEMKISKSDFSIDNSDGLDNTRKQVKFIYGELADLAGKEKIKDPKGNDGNNQRS